MRPSLLLYTKSHDSAHRVQLKGKKQQKKNVAKGGKKKERHYFLRGYEQMGKGSPVLPSLTIFRGG